MHPWLVMPLALSALCLGTGLVLSERGGGVVSTLCLLVGAAIGAIVLALWAARTGQSLRGGVDSLSRGRELSELASSLTENAALAHDKGVLMLADARVPLRQGLFARGASMVVAGSSVDEIRRALSEQAAQEAAEAGRTHARAAALCRWAPPAALVAALGAVAAASGSLIQGQSLAPGGAILLLVVVYAAFMTVGLTAHVRRSLDERAAAFELTGDLIIEAIVGLREGEKAEVVRQRVDRILRPGRVEMLRGAARKAA